MVGRETLACHLTRRERGQWEEEKRKKLLHFVNPQQSKKYCYLGYIGSGCSKGEPLPLPGCLIAALRAQRAEQVAVGTLLHPALRS